MSSIGVSRRKISVGPVLAYLLLIFMSLCILYPLYFTLISSFKSNNDLFSNPFGLPKMWFGHVYVDVFTKFDIGLYLMNSLYYTVITVVLSILFSSMAAYAIVRMKWRGSKFVFGSFLLALMVPGHASLIPLYIGVMKVGITDPRIVLLMLFVSFAIPTTVFILAGFLQTVPKELEESAVIDGYSIVRVFFGIVLPLLKPALATVAILTFLSTWNDFFVSLIFINDESQKTLQLGITRFQGLFATQYSQLLAALIISMIPTFVVYMLLQNKIVAGVTAGSVKG